MEGNISNIILLSLHAFIVVRCSLWWVNSLLFITLCLLTEAATYRTFFHRLLLLLLLHGAHTAQ